MPGSDRTQYKQALVGSIGDSRTVSNGVLVIAQDAQRYVDAGVPGGLAANTGVNAPMARVERPVLIKECRILPGAAATIAGNPGNTVFTVGYTNDNGGVFTSVATINSNTVANGGTGNLSAFVSVVIPLFTAATANANLNQTSNMIVPSGSQLIAQVTATAPSVALGAFTVQVIWEEV